MFWGVREVGVGERIGRRNDRMSVDRRGDLRFFQLFFGVEIC